MLNRDHPTYARYAREVRDRFGSITAYRMGYVVGLDEGQDPAACPYPDARGARLFEQGVAAGHEWRARHGLKNSGELA